MIAYQLMTTASFLGTQVRAHVHSIFASSTIGFCEQCVRLRSIVFMTEHGNPIAPTRPFELARCYWCNIPVASPRLHILSMDMLAVCWKRVIQAGGPWAAGRLYPTFHVNLTPTSVHLKRTAAQWLRRRWHWLARGWPWISQATNNGHIDEAVFAGLFYEPSMAPSRFVYGTSDIWTVAVEQGWVRWGNEQRIAHQWDVRSPTLTDDSTSVYSTSASEADPDELEEGDGEGEGQGVAGFDIWNPEN